MDLSKLRIGDKIDISISTGRFYKDCVLIDILPSGVRISSDLIKKYYQITEDNSIFDGFCRPSRYDRYVFRFQGDDGDSHYLIIPNSPITTSVVCIQTTL